MPYDARSVKVLRTLVRRGIEAMERTFAANHASGVAIFVNTELCNLKELLGPPKEVVWVYQLLKRVGGD